ncbi:MAG: HD domain-containing protein [Clostridia bacterium]|nr:HD domain-containing protein [Clostridia bacterium]
MTITYDLLRRDESVRALVAGADDVLAAIGYTEHSFAHVTRVSDAAAMILTRLGYDERTVELARIAGLLHDIGNLVNRSAHAQTGAVMAFRVLREKGMPANEVVTVVSAIGNHDEESGEPVSPVSAALILADKTDVRRSRVRNHDKTTFDMHDRVNYSVKRSHLTFSDDGSSLLLETQIDTGISAVLDYFEIFLARMIMCRKAAAFLGLSFRLEVNGQSIL